MTDNNKCNNNNFDDFDNFDNDDLNNNDIDNNSVALNINIHDKHLKMSQFTSPELFKNYLTLMNDYLL